MSEEQWPSMDLFASMLAEFIPLVRSHYKTEVVRFPLKRYLSRALPLNGVRTLDRLIGRHLTYPRGLRSERDDHRVIYHVVDQTYAAACLSLPGERTVVTCHDLDAFGPSFDHKLTPANAVLKPLARRTLKGLCRASRVVCDTEAIAGELTGLGLIPAERVIVAHAGVHPRFVSQRDAVADAILDQLIGSPEGPELLHVGSTIPRKRIDLLLLIFAELRKNHPKLRMIRAGGRLNAAQRGLAERLGVLGHIAELPPVPVDVIASAYRRATLSVLPSRSEGFGLPVIESLACGTPIVATDISVLREVGADAVTYVGKNDAKSWAGVIDGLLNEAEHNLEQWNARTSRGFGQASRFTWMAHAEILTALYDSITNS